MGGGAIHDPLTDLARKTADKAGLFGSGPNRDLIGKLAITGPGDIAGLGAYGKISEATAPTEVPAPTDLEAPPTPTTAAPQISAAEADQRRARGRASTILAGNSPSDSSGLIARRTLLGS